MTGRSAYSACLAAGVLAAGLVTACDKGTTPPKKSAPPTSAGELAGALPPAAATPPEPVPPADPKKSGGLVGQVRFEGKVPLMPALDRSRDSKCPQDPVTAAWLVVGKTGELANAVVWVDLPAGSAPAQSSEPAVIDQKGCLYAPPVTAIVAGQAVRVKNSDDTFHNVHSTVDAETKFNDAHLQGTPDKIYTPAIGGGQAMRLACDVHPWMEAWIFAAPTRFFAVTDASGQFRIGGVPAGKVKVALWHPFLAATSVEVTVLAGQDTIVNLPARRANDYHGPKP